MENHMDSIIEVGNIIVSKDTNIRYRVIRISENFVFLCQLDVTKLVILEYNISALLQLLMDKELIIQTDSEDDCVIDIDNMSDGAKKRYECYRNAINEIMILYHNNLAELSGKKPKPQLYAILEKYSIPRSNFWRTITKYFQSGMKDSSIVDARIFGNSKNKEYNFTSKNGKKSSSFRSGVIITDEIRSYFDEALKEYRSGRNKSLYSCYTNMNYLHFRRTEIVNGKESISLLPASERPTKRQFYYYANKQISEQEKDIIKTSAQEQRNNKRLITSDALFDVSGPGDMVEIDACEADVSLVSSIDPNRAIGRPVVYFMIDVFTRMIIAVSVAFDNNSILGITNLFLNLADDKHEYCGRYGIGFDNGEMWQSNIIPRRVRVDRGSEFKSKEFERICLELGIEKQLVPGASGSLKGIVEQSFHQMHSKQNPHLENNGLIEKRYDSYHHKEATLDIDQYTKMIINFVLTHNQEYDSAYRMTKEMINENIQPIPSLLWKYGVSKYGNPRPITSKTQYMYNLMTPIKAKIDRRGISYKGLYYLPQKDVILSKEMFKAGKKKVAFDARMDMRDVGHIYYLRDNKLIDAPLNDRLTGNADFANLTMKQYEDYLFAKKQMNAKGEIYNQELSAYSYSVNASIVDSAKKETYSESKNMRPARELEKQKVSRKGKISTRIKEVSAIEETETPQIPNKAEEKANTPEKKDKKYKDFKEALGDFWDEN